jgi:hypothetical protein
MRRILALYRTQQVCTLQHKKSQPKRLAHARCSRISPATQFSARRKKIREQRQKQKKMADDSPPSVDEVVRFLINTCAANLPKSDAISFELNMINVVLAYLGDLRSSECDNFKKYFPPCRF